MRCLLCMLWGALLAAPESLNDTHYMQLLVESARANPLSLPFVSMIVRTSTGAILCQKANPRTHTGGSPLAHAEMETIADCYKKYGKAADFPSTTLYTTAESCPMCAAGASWAHVGRVVYGTSIDFLVQSGWGQIHISSQEIADRTDFCTVQVTGGVLYKETDKLFEKGPPDFLRQKPNELDEAAQEKNLRLVWLSLAIISVGLSMWVSCATMRGGGASAAAHGAAGRGGAAGAAMLPRNAPRSSYSSQGYGSEV
eukprot:g49179.t1